MHPSIGTDDPLGRVLLKLIHENVRADFYPTGRSLVVASVADAEGEKAVYAKLDTLAANGFIVKVPYYGFFGSHPGEGYDITEAGDAEITSWIKEE